METNFVISKLKEKFIDNEIWVLTFSASFQRANIYKDKVSNENKNKLKHKIRKHIENIVDSKYKEEKCSSLEHSKNIVKFSDKITVEFGNILIGNKFRIGIAQKLFNLYLKYLWCLGRIEEPPHCPFDRVIIKDKDKLNLKINWTELDNIEKYNQLVDMAMIKANEDGLSSIAKWELKVFRRR